MFINSAFDTAACSAVPIKKIIDAVTRASVSGSMAVAVVRAGRHEDGFKIHMVQGGDPFTDEVPYFNQPLLLDAQEGSEEKQLIVIDVRNFGKYDARINKFHVRNAPEYSLALRRAILNKIWLDEPVQTLRDLSDLPVMVFTALMADTIGHRFSASPYEHSVIATLAAYYYFSQFTNEEEFQELELQLMPAKINKITQVPIQMIQDILQGQPCLHGIESLIEAIKNKVSNPAFDNFNLGMLLTLVRASWYGSGAQEMVGAALEHPPTWIALVEAATASRTFKSTPLARISQRFTRNNIAQLFLRAVDLYCGGPEAVTIDGKVDTSYSSQSKL